jgi:hypothetical protein
LILVTVSFAIKKLFSLMQSICSFFILNAEFFEICLESHSPCLSAPVYFLLLPTVFSKFQALY